MLIRHGFELRASGELWCSLWDPGASTSMIAAFEAWAKSGENFLMVHGCGTDFGGGAMVALERAWVYVAANMGGDPLVAVLNGELDRHQYDQARRFCKLRKQLKQRLRVPQVLGGVDQT